MGVHLFGRAEAEAKCRVFQKPFAAPGWYVQETTSAGRQQAIEFRDGACRLPQVFQYGDAQNHVERLRFDLGQHLGDRSGEPSDFWMIAQVGGNGNIGQEGCIHCVENGASEGRVIATAKIANAIAAKLWNVSMN